VTAGSIRFRGRDIGRLTTHEVARAGLSLVPQGRRVFASLSVEENLSIAARRGVSAVWDLRGVYELFPRLQERSGQRAGTLSGGEQQMLAIGRALMANPELIVMDEPSEGLSPAMVEQVGERIRDLRARGHGVLLAEQNVDLALSVADRVAVIGDGGVMSWTGRPDQLRADDALVAQLVGLQPEEEVARA
jgi:branched-chain amino acid transport system ATP-binding protein